jgi:hypothetical protein
MDSPISRHHLRPSSSFSNGSHLLYQYHQQQQQQPALKGNNKNGANSPPRLGPLPPLPPSSSTGNGNGFYSGNMNTGIAMANNSNNSSSKVAADTTDNDREPLLTSQLPSSGIPPISTGKKKTLTIAAAFDDDDENSTNTGTDEENPLIPRKVNSSGVSSKISPKGSTNIVAAASQEPGFFESLMQKSFFSNNNNNKKSNTNTDKATIAAPTTTHHQPTVTVSLYDEHEMDYVDMPADDDLFLADLEEDRSDKKHNAIMTPMLSLDRLSAPSLSILAAADGTTMNMDNSLHHEDTIEVGALTSGVGAGSSTPYSAYSRHNAIMIENTRLMIAELVSQIR